jgi:hypothetical protein
VVHKTCFIADSKIPEDKGELTEDSIISADKYNGFASAGSRCHLKEYRNLMKIKIVQISNI